MTDAAIAGGRLGRVPEPGRRLFAALAGRLAAEGERRLLWLPVFFGAGIGLYFALRFEPPLWLGPAARRRCGGIRRGAGRRWCSPSPPPASPGCSCAPARRAGRCSNAASARLSSPAESSTSTPSTAAGG